MSLAKQATKLNILLTADGTASNRVEYEVAVQNKDIEITPEFFSGGAFDESIGGKRISNLRGYRVRINLSYDGAIETAQKIVGTSSAVDSTYREMFNEMMSCFSSGTITESVPNTSFDKMYVRVGTNAGTQNAVTINATSGTFMGFIPEDISYTQTYSNQIGRFRPSITLVSEDLMPSIPEELEGVL